MTRREGRIYVLCATSIASLAMSYYMTWLHDWKAMLLLFVGSACCAKEMQVTVQSNAGDKS